MPWRTSFAFLRWLLLRLLGIGIYDCAFCFGQHVSGLDTLDNVAKFDAGNFVSLFLGDCHNGFVEV